jgi:uncharacterized protein YndB with AHSA1/START domain
MSDEAVKAKTGKDWKSWFAILDKAGAKKMSHSEIAGLLSSTHAVGPWWTQMVAVTYEQTRGLRAKHQKPDGYEIGVSRTINVPLVELFKSFSDTKQRGRWLPEKGLLVRTSTENKCMRVTWNDGKTSLEIYFDAKGEHKSQVVVQHSKLPNAKAASQMKTYWSAALDRLRELLEA